jgi:hypothetical protein
VKELAGRMLSRQSVRSRLESEQGISLTEFSYQAFQAYDWLRLYQGRSTRTDTSAFPSFATITGISLYSLKGTVCRKNKWGITGIYCIGQRKTTYKFYFSVILKNCFLRVPYEEYP